MKHAYLGPLHISAGRVKLTDRRSHVYVALGHLRVAVRGHVLCLSW